MRSQRRLCLVWALRLWVMQWGVWSSWLYASKVSIYRNVYILWPPALRDNTGGCWQHRLKINGVGKCSYNFFIDYRPFCCGIKYWGWKHNQSKICMEILSVWSVVWNILYFGVTPKNSEVRAFFNSLHWWLAAEKKGWKTKMEQKLTWWPIQKQIFSFVDISWKRLKLNLS